MRDDGDVPPDGPIESWLVPRRVATVGTDAVDACDAKAEDGAVAWAACACAATAACACAACCLRVASTICCAALCGGWAESVASLASLRGADENVLLTFERSEGRRPVSGSSWKGLGKVVKLDDVSGGAWLENWETGDGPLGADTPVSGRRCGSDIGRGKWCYGEGAGDMSSRLGEWITEKWKTKICWAAKRVL